MKKAICMLLACLMLNCLLVTSIFAESEIPLTANTTTDITDNPPQMQVVDEAQLPADSSDAEAEGFFSKYKWWLLAGLVVIGGATAAGGGGGGGSSSDNPTGPTTGNIQIDW